MVPEAVGSRPISRPTKQIFILSSIRLFSLSQNILLSSNGIPSKSFAWSKSKFEIVSNLGKFFYQLSINFVKIIY